MDNLEIINLEGLDDRTIGIVADKLIEEFKKQGKKAEFVSFPKLYEKSGSMINNHLLGFPRADITAMINFEELLYAFNEKDLFFAYAKEDKSLLLLAVDSINKETGIISVTNMVNRHEFILSREEQHAYTFYKAVYNKIFNWDVKASHVTKGMLYTVDRNIWFTNNMKKIEKLDYLIVNRSYLANFMYRTVDIEDTDAFFEYIISIYVNEIRSTGLDKFKIHSYYVSTSDIMLQMELLKKYYLEYDLKGINMFKRNEQYYKTIWSNHNHMNKLLQGLKEDLPLVSDKYTKYAEMTDININIHDYSHNLNKVSDFIIDDINRKE